MRHILGNPPPTASLAEAAEALYPGVTEFAQSYDDGVIGFRLHGVLTEVFRDRPRQPLNRLPKPAASTAMQDRAFPACLRPPSAWEATEWHAEAGTAQEAALMAGLVVLYDQEADCWRSAEAARPELLPSEDDAQEAIRWLRSARWWPPRGKLSVDRPPWRNGRAWFLFLNGPTEGAEARLFSWAIGTTLHYPYVADWDWVQRMLESARGLRSTTPGRLPQAWDWNREPKVQGGGPLDIASSNPNLGTPWPIWADELTAQRRLLQEAARLLHDANEQAWSDNKRHPVKLPAVDTWPAISSLCDRLSRGIGLELNGTHQTMRVSPTQSAVYHLWLSVNGFAHLRQCATCGRWVIAYHRPRRTCDSTCRVASHRKSPAVVTGKRP